MENNDLLEMVRSKAQGWLTKSYDAETRAQVQALLFDRPSALICTSSLLGIETHKEKRASYFGQK